MQKRKLTSHRDGQPLKIKYFENDGDPYIDIKEPSKENQGTDVEFRSPLLRQLPVGSSIIERFENMTAAIPIYLNGVRINSAEGLIEYSFAEGAIRLRIGGLEVKSAFDDLTVACKLSICEAGRTIKTFTTIGYALPQHVAIDFKRLTLSQDRKTLDLSAPDFRKKIEDLTSFIFTTFPPYLASLLLNALHPIITDPSLDLIDMFQASLADSKISFIPAIKEFVISLNPNSYYLHPDYLPTALFLSVPYLSHNKCPSCEASVPNQSTWFRKDTRKKLHICR